MTIIKHKLLIATLLVVFSGQAFAACEAPSAPIVPDGNVASEDELVAAQKALKSYQADLGDYRGCLQLMQQGVDVTAEDADAQSAAILAKYNASVDGESAAAEEFNAAVRAFKARQ